MPDPLAEAERRLLAALPAGDWGPFQAALVALDPMAPAADAGDPRRSAAELLQIAAALGAPVSAPPPLPSPALYALDEAARARPGVVTHGEPSPELELVDRAAFLAPTPEKRAVLWLDSPARRLLHDLETLLALRGSAPGGWDPGATNLSATRLLQAIGTDGGEAWRELHHLVPGAPLLHWTPAGRTLPWALDRLERPDPLGLRGALLPWLLCHPDPFYTVDDLKRKLQDDLLVRLAIALSAAHPDAEEVALGARLERLLLLHAACIGDVHGWDAAGTWRLARWLYATLTRSPFFGADRPALVARLGALLPEALPPPAADLLHPSWFAPEGLDPGEVFLVAGMAAAILRSADVLVAVSPLKHALQALAARILRPSEHAAEKALFGPADTLAWRTLRAPHVAPPLAARSLLTRSLKATWLQQAGEAVQQECLDLFLEEPERHAWVPLAWMQEPTASPAALRAWRSFDGPKWMAGALAVGVASALEAAEVPRALAHAAAAGDWAAPLLGRLATLEVAWWGRAVEALLGLAETGSTPAIRLNALLQAVQVLSRRRPAAAEEVAPLLEHANRLAPREPFRGHPGLQRELRRLAS